MPLKPRMPYMLPADHALRRKIGRNVNLEEIFTLEKIAQCQEIVNHAHAESLVEMKAKVDRLGEEFVGAAEDPVRAALVLKEGGMQALTIKKKMEELGFSFGFEAAGSLYEYLHAVPAYSPDVMLVVCKHVAVLNIILRETLANLRKLARKVEK